MTDNKTLGLGEDKKTVQNDTAPAAANRDSVRAEASGDSTRRYSQSDRNSNPAARRRPASSRRPGGPKRERAKEEGKMSVLGIRRVAKVGEGAKRFSFSVCVVVGDMNGKVGLGIGKGRDVNSAIMQATARARKAQVAIPLKNGTIPYQTTAVFCKSQVLVRSAPQGTGIKAGNVVRAICTCLGVQDIVTKVIGNRNFLNVAKAAVGALTKIRPGIV